MTAGGDRRKENEDVYGKSAARRHNDGLRMFGTGHGRRLLVAAAYNCANANARRCGAWTADDVALGDELRHGAWTVDDTAPAMSSDVGHGWRRTRPRR